MKAFSASTKPKQEIYGKIHKLDGTVIDLGRLSSPWPDNSLRNWLWKKLYKEPQIRLTIKRSGH